MPTNRPRVQALLEPEVIAKVQTLAKHNRRSMSAMTAELVEAALAARGLQKEKSQITEARLKKLQVLLELLENY